MNVSQHMWPCSLRHVHWTQRYPNVSRYYTSVIRGGCCDKPFVSRNNVASLHWNDRHVANSSFSSVSEEADRIRCLLQKFKEGSVTLESTIAELSSIQNTDQRGAMDTVLSSFANIDHHRRERTNFPEVVFAQGKTPEQVAMILEAMVEKSKNSTDVSTNRTPVLATRVTQEMYNSIAAQHIFRHGTLTYHPTARIISLRSIIPSADTQEHSNNGDMRVVVATAGTTDIMVAEEAAVVLEASNVPVDRIFDVGVAGLHRILSALPKLTHPQVGCIIVCAGMDGALPSVVGGLVPVPVIAVPTSVGYGASFQGVSALLTMLNSCAPGVCVMNIDNGFGAAAFAYKCLQLCKTNGDSNLPKAT